MKFDPVVFQFITPKIARVMMAVERLMRNHEYAPLEKIGRISASVKGDVSKILQEAENFKLVKRPKNDSQKIYSLTHTGYDYMALRTLMMQQMIAKIGEKIGVGKEADIYRAAMPNGEIVVLKIHRLGRVCFHTARHKRDYLGNRQNKSWFNMSRLSCEAETKNLGLLANAGIRVPRIVAQNRHCLILEYLKDHILLNHLRHAADPVCLLKEVFRVLMQMAKAGFVHSDYNEFNIMVSPEGEVVVIDVPQMIPVSHRDARKHYERDLMCICTFFRRRFGLAPEDYISYTEFSEMPHRANMP